jgi:hypothetical protein
MSIPVRLMQDVLPFATQVEKLRFHLCLEDIEELRQMQPALAPTLPAFNTLLTADCRAMRDRRTYALLGQSLLGNREVLSLQFRDVMAVVDPQLFFATRPLPLLQLEGLSSGLELSGFDLEDEDHDGDNATIAPTGRLVVGLEFSGFDLEDEDHDGDDATIAPTGRLVVGPGVQWF